MSPQDYMHAASPAARAIADFGGWVLIVFCIAAAIVWLLLVRLAMRYDDGNFAEHAPAEDEKGRSWILIGGLAIPAVVFLTFFALMFAPMASTAHQHGARAADQPNN